MALPKFQTTDRSLSLLQTNWASSLDPVLSNPLIQGLALKNVSLVPGANTFNHLLARKQQGYFITDQQGIADIYHPATSPFNSQTLTLVCNANVLVSLWVY